MQASRRRVSRVTVARSSATVISSTTPARRVRFSALEPWDSVFFRVWMKAAVFSGVIISPADADADADADAGARARAVDGLPQSIAAGARGGHALGEGRLGRVEEAAFDSLVEAVENGLGLVEIGLRLREALRLFRLGLDPPASARLEHGGEGLGIE